jgi:spermidine/putrescine ABC transporter ATP-binding subunit
MATVALQTVSKRFGSSSHSAVNSLSLDINSGEFLTLLGPSGCGKTTTLRLIAGLIQPDIGRVLIRDRDVTSVPAHRRNIGMVFQSHALFPHLSISENVAFGLKMRGIVGLERERKVREALSLVRLGEFGDRFPSQLSGGQQQRVALARALVFQPDVLLLDEPFGALDRKLRETMQDELRELSRRLAVTSVFVTHDQEEALMLSDRIAIMNSGSIEQAGRPDQIFDFPQSRFVADFMGIANIFDGEIVSCDRSGAAVQIGRLRFETAPSAGLKAGQKMALAFRPEHVRITPDGTACGGFGAGTVISRVYQGVTCTYQIHLDDGDGRILVVREAVPSGACFRFDVGAKVSATCAKDAIHVLTR